MTHLIKLFTRAVVFHKSFLGINEMAVNTRYLEEAKYYVDSYKILPFLSLKSVITTMMELNRFLIII